MNCRQEIRDKVATQQFETIKLSTITPSDINKMNLISDKYYVSERISNVAPPIRVQAKLRDVYQYKGSNVYVNDNTSFIYKRPSICKVKVLQNQSKAKKNIEEVEKSILLGFYERLSTNHFKDGKLKKSPKRQRHHRFSHSQKLDQSFDPIIITKKPYHHMKYHVKDYSMEQSYEKDLEVLKKKININSSFNGKTIEQFLDEQKQIQNIHQQSVQFQKYKPDIVLPEIQSSRYQLGNKKSKKARIDSKVFLYNTPWANDDDQIIRHSFSQPKNKRH